MSSLAGVVGVGEVGVVAGERLDVCGVITKWAHLYSSYQHSLAQQSSVQHSSVQIKEVVVVVVVGGGG